MRSFSSSLQSRRRKFMFRRAFCRLRAAFAATALAAGCLFSNAAAFPLYGAETPAVHIASSGASAVYEKGGSCIDASNASKGYIMAKQTGQTSALKVQIEKDGKKYNYNLNNAGNLEVFPLQMGNGKYTVKIFRQTSGSKYSSLFATTLDVKLDSEFEPFLYNNQYVNYTAGSEAVKKAAELCKDAKTDLEKAQSIYKYITGTITYDTNLANKVTSGYLPDVDSVLKNKTGICFDYAALMACMLRSQNVPAKLICGKVAPDNLSHAWNEVYIENAGWISVGLAANGSSWERTDPTFGAAKSEDITRFIGNGTNYTAERVY